MRSIRSMSFRAVLAIAPLLLAPVANAGPLDPPPGPVAPTNKTLDQVRPGTPIETFPFIVSQPGAYYLTANSVITGTDDAIIVIARDVTIDLGGFALQGPGPESGLSAVRINASGPNCRVFNGSISGFSTGVTGVAQNTVLEGLRISRCGTGVNAPASLVSGCTATENTGAGFLITIAEFVLPTDPLAVYTSTPIIQRCAAVANAQGGFVLPEGSTITDSHAVSNRRFGISAGPACRVQRCTVTGTLADASVGAPGFGITIDTACTVDDCTVRSCESGGIFLASSRNTVRDCSVSLNGGFGIGGPNSQFGYYARIEGCHVSGTTGPGITVVADCTIINNVVINNSTIGIQLNGSANRAEGNTCRGSPDAGIFVAPGAFGCRIKGNDCAANGTVGGAFNFTANLVVWGDRNHIEDNTASNGPNVGFFILGQRNTVVSNRAGANPNVNFYFQTQNNQGPLIDRSAAGAGIPSSDPAANISY